MSKYKYSEIEQQMNDVLAYHTKELSGISFPDTKKIDASIAQAEAKLKALGIDVSKANSQKSPMPEKKVMLIPTWNQMVAEAQESCGTDNALESLFTAEELQCNREAIRLLNKEYNQLQQLDKFDVGISAVAGIIGGAVDILLVGIPQRGYDGVEAGPLSNYIRDRFDKAFPAEEMEKLANSKVSKVSFDAQDNRNTTEYVTGLSAYYHRLLSLGHDPLLGFIVGVFDILTGRMTTIDKTGKIVSQVMENYADRKKSDIFAALSKQIIHFKSDIATSMGLPAPLMGLFNLLQFGSIGEEEQTIAEIVQGMYYEGYDFIHFCSLSIPAMLVEVVVRLGYAIKRIKEGHKVLESIPFSINREKHPKLATMLFIAHSGATAINAGKVYFTKNPMAINYPQWIAFVKYSYKQIKWVLLKKSEARDAYVSGKLYDNLKRTCFMVDKCFEEFSSGYIVVFDSP
ncbi:hypothetical protein LAD12857_15470 [Lacrimispora amygdalina]|uniref:Uncharacterized protein n=1 Tax=Lacrimispora amygdalina TaxID=253257 RepID=A0ABQ5M3U4_9FIRM